MNPIKKIPSSQLELVPASPLPPYLTIAAMLADQVNQETGFIYIAGTEAYIKLATSAAVIGDYFPVEKNQNPTLIIQNEPQSTTSTTPVLVRSINIGLLSDYKKMQIQSETVSDNGNFNQKVILALENNQNGSFIVLHNSTSVPNQYIFKDFYISSNLIFNNINTPDIFSNNIYGGNIVPSVFNFNNTYSVILLISANTTETIINNGITISLYK